MRVDARAVADLWSAVLHVEAPPPDQQFFAAGGQSLDAARLVAAMQRRLGVRIALPDVLGCRDLAGLTALVLKAADESPRLPGLEELGPAPAGRVSLQTERKLLIEQNHSLAARRIVSVAYRIRGELDVVALGRAIEDLGRRHTVLVSRFVDSPSGPLLLPDPNAVLRLERLTAVRSGDGDNWFDTEVDRFFDRPFALSTGPLARVALIEGDAADSVFALSVQHYVFDGWSLKIFLHDLAEAYDAQVSRGRWEPPELTVSHVDFAHWQREVLTGNYQRHLLSFWQDYLACARLDVPVRGMGQRSAFRPHGGLMELEIDADIADSWRQYARTTGVTLFALMLAAMTIAIRSLGGPSDICAHTSVANRRLAEFEDIIGYFNHGIVIRNRVEARQTFQALAGAVFESCRSAYQHQDLPYSELVRVLWPDHYTAGPMLETLYLDVYNNADTQLRLGDADVRRLERTPTTADPGINGFVINYGDSDRIVLQLLHNYDSIDAELAGVILAAWRSALEQGIAAPLQPIGALSSGDLSGPSA